MKKTVISIFIAVLCFGLAACGSGKDNASADPVINSQTQNQANGSDGADDPVLKSDDTKVVIGNVDLATVYYYEGETITGLESFIRYDTPESAKVAKIKFENDTSGANDDVIEYRIDGRYLVLVYGPDQYQYENTTELKKAAAEIQAYLN